MSARDVVGLTMWSLLMAFVGGILALAFIAPRQANTRADLGYAPTACQASIAHYRGLYYGQEHAARTARQRARRAERDLQIERVRTRAMESLLETRAHLASK